MTTISAIWDVRSESSDTMDVTRRTCSASVPVALTAPATTRAPSALELLGALRHLDDGVRPLQRPLGRLRDLDGRGVGLVDRGRLGLGLGRAAGGRVVDGLGLDVDAPRGGRESSRDHDEGAGHPGDAPGGVADLGGRVQWQRRDARPRCAPAGRR